MWFLLSVLIAHPAQGPLFTAAFADRGSCMARASKLNGPSPDRLMQPAGNGRLFACFRMEYPT